MAEVTHLHPDKGGNNGLPRIITQAQYEELRIVLTWSEVWQAAICGVMRRVKSMRAGLDANKHARISDWSTDINGAAAELAFAKFSGRYWDAGVNTFKAPDIGSDIQVRSTEHWKGHLIVRENDSDNDIFVFVVTAVPVCHIIGWLDGYSCKHSDYWRAGAVGESGAWWVPQNVLRPDFGSLRK